MSSSYSRDSHSVPHGSVLGPMFLTVFPYETLNDGMNYTYIVRQVRANIETSSVLKTQSSRLRSNGDATSLASRLTVKKLGLTFS